MSRPPSIGTRRASVLPALVMPPRRIVLPDAGSLGQQTEMGHQPPGVGKAAEVADFRDNGDGNHQGDPAHRLQRLGEVAHCLVRGIADPIRHE